MTSYTIKCILNQCTIVRISQCRLFSGITCHNQIISHINVTFCIEYNIYIYIYTVYSIQPISAFRIYTCPPGSDNQMQKLDYQQRQIVKENESTP